MYVLRIRESDECRYKYFMGIECNTLVLTDITSKAMVFLDRSDCLQMASFILNYFVFLRPDVFILPLDDDEKVDFRSDFTDQSYFIL